MKESTIIPIAVNGARVSVPGWVEVPLADKRVEREGDPKTWPLSFKTALTRERVIEISGIVPHAGARVRVDYQGRDLAAGESVAAEPDGAFSVTLEPIQGAT